MERKGPGIEGIEPVPGCTRKAPAPALTGLAGWRMCRCFQPVHFAVGRARKAGGASKPAQVSVRVRSSTTRAPQQRRTCGVTAMVEREGGLL